MLRRVHNWDLRFSDRGSGARGQETEVGFWPTKAGWRWQNLEAKARTSVVIIHIAQAEKRPIKFKYLPRGILKFYCIFESPGRSFKKSYAETTPRTNYRAISGGEIQASIVFNPPFPPGASSMRKPVTSPGGLVKTQDAGPHPGVSD